jgi:hypothetical protein
MADGIVRNCALLARDAHAVAFCSSPGSSRNESLRLLKNVLAKDPGNFDAIAPMNAIAVALASKSGSV